MIYFDLLYISFPGSLGYIGLCIKVGRGQGDRDACVRTWDLGTREEGLGDVKYRTRGRGDVKNWDAGDPG